MYVFTAWVFVAYSWNWEWSQAYSIKDHSLRVSTDQSASEKWKSYFQARKDTGRQKQQMSTPDANKKSNS